MTFLMHTLYNFFSNSFWFGASSRHCYLQHLDFLKLDSLPYLYLANFATLEKNGIERTQIADLFGQILFACPIYQNYGRAITTQQYEPAGFKLSLGLKDVTLALQTAQESQMPLPFASLLHDRLIASVARGKGDIDWTGLALSISEEAGLK